jgi:NADH-quinone oxidoreductase subunit E
MNAQPTMNRDPKEVLSAAVRAEIDRWVAKYPPDQKQSAIMAALSAAQEANGGNLTNELIEACAGYLEMPAIAALEVATFYTMYRHRPMGRYVIEVCTNISCLLCGSEAVVEQLEKKLGIKMGETTADGKFTLKEVECLGACVGAPMMQIGKQYYENLDAPKLDKILAGLK